MNIVGIIMAAGDVLVRLVGAISKPAAAPAKPDYAGGRIPARGETWELIRAAQRPFAKTQVRARVRDVQDGWVVYVFIDRDRVETRDLSSMEVDSFVELYRPTSG